MHKNIDPDRPAQALGDLTHGIILRLIDSAPSPLVREDRIQIALDEGALTYAEAYQLRDGQ